MRDDFTVIWAGMERRNIYPIVFPSARLLSLKWEDDENDPSVKIAKARDVFGKEYEFLYENGIVQLDNNWKIFTAQFFDVEHNKEWRRLLNIPRESSYGDFEVTDDNVDDETPQFWDNDVDEDEEDFVESRRPRGRMLKEDVDKKYELTDETIKVDGHTLHRIIALKDFSDVKAGDLGGWIESEKNLSQEGKCWVYDEAKVSGDAQIYGNALVRWNADVYGNASVYGDAKVYEAKVYGNAKVYKNAEVSGDIWIHDNAQVHGFVKLDSYSSVGPLDICGNADISAFYQVVLGPKERRTLN